MRVFTIDPPIQNQTGEASTSDPKEAATFVPEELVDCKEAVKLDIARLNRLYDQQEHEAARKKRKASPASRTRPLTRKLQSTEIGNVQNSVAKRPRTSFSSVTKDEGGSKYIRTTYYVPPENIFAKDGDLILSISSVNDENRGTNFLVSSHVVVANSSTFGRMLDVENGFQEGEQLRKWHHGMTPVVIKLEDNPEPLHLVLQILFHQNKHIKRQLTIKEFYEVAVLVDKYDLQSTIQIWADIWRKEGLLTWRCHQAKHQPEDAPLVLMIAWIFGLEREFWYATRCIMQRYTILPPNLPCKKEASINLRSATCTWHYHPDKQFVDNLSPHVEFPSIPDCVFESLLTYHSFIRKSLRDLFSDEQTRRANAPIGLSNSTFCKYRPRRRTAQYHADTAVCDLYQLGLISHGDTQEWFLDQVTIPLRPPYENEVLCDVSLITIFRNIENFHKFGCDKPYDLKGTELKLYHCPKAAGVDPENHRCNCSALSLQTHRDCGWYKAVQKRTRVLRNVGIPLGEFRSRRDLFAVVEKNAFKTARETEEKRGGKEDYFGSDNSQDSDEEEVEPEESDPSSSTDSELEEDD